MIQQQTPVQPSPQPAVVLPAEPPARESIGEVLDLQRLLRMQQSLAEVARLRLTVRDAQGQPIEIAPVGSPGSPIYGAPGPGESLLAPLVPPAEQSGAREYIAPVLVDGQQVGSIVIEPIDASQPSPALAAGQSELRELAIRLGIAPEAADRLVAAAVEMVGPHRPAAVQMLYLWANGIARVCYQEHQLKQRIEELGTLYKLSTLLSTHRDLQQVLDVACRSAAQAMKVKAASIRLLDDAGKELISRAVYNLSEVYLNKGPILVEESELNRQALTGQVVYVEEMSNDPRIVYPEDAQREGLVSILGAGLIFQGKPIGVIRIYTGERRVFSPFEAKLLTAIAHIAAAAIENTRLDADRNESMRVQRQLRLAADVQRRLLPASPPKIPPFDIAARYVPSFELSGDFYDFIPLEGHLGVTVGDVVGKGIAASLLMASVRASIRAYAQDVYDIDEIIARVNVQLVRDTLDNEFATLFYGVLDPSTARLTYCNAGQEPPLLLRDGQLSALNTGGMIVGVDGNQEYEKGVVQLKKDDLILIFTDGLTDAFNFARQKFGRPRVIEAMKEAGKGKMSARDALNHILWQMRRFTGLRTNDDDLTMVTIKVTANATAKSAINR